MTTAWAHLPNAAHIDRVLAHLKQHPARWSAAWDATRGAAWDAWTAARGAAWDAAWDAARSAARGAAWGAARDAAWDAARDPAWSAAWDAARSAIAALVAWDDCAYLLDQAPDFLRAQINLTGEPAALLLLPAVIAMRGPL